MRRARAGEGGAGGSARAVGMVWSRLRRGGAGRGGAGRIETRFWCMAPQRPLLGAIFKIVLKLF